MGVPYTFSTSTSSIPLSQLDTNFATPVTIGSTTVALGNTTTTLAGLTGVTSSAITDSALTANQIVYAGTGGLLSGSANFTYDTSGNVLLGTTTAYTSTTYGGQFASGGVGIYPWIIGNTGIANTANYTGVVYQNPTAWSGTNGASSQSIYGIFSSPQISNTGAGGASSTTATGIYIQPVISSSGSSAVISATGISSNIFRYSPTDTSVSFGSLIGMQCQVNQFPTLPSTVVSTNLVAFNSFVFNNQGTVTNAYNFRKSLSLATTSSVSNTCFITNYYGYAALSVTVGTASASIGTLTNYYCVYLVNPTINATGTITNRWAIYSADTATSYLAGSLGIGTTTPAGKLDVAGTIKTLGYTVATLPTGTVGMQAYATDALTPVFGSTVVGGGAVVIPVFYNGSNWIVG